MLFKTQLDVIEEDLSKWRAGKKLHKYRIFWCAAALPGGIFLCGVFHQQPVYFFIGMAVGLILFAASSGKMDVPDSWEGRINQALQSYNPIDKDAFEKLCLTVKEKRAIEPNDIAAWLKDEKEARVLFERQRDEQQRYSFTKWLDKRESDQKAECNEEGK